MAKLLVSLLLLFSASVAFAQPQSYEPETAKPLQLPPDPKETITPKVAPDKAMTVSIKVVHGATGQPIAKTPVFLRAARVRGPFEPSAPKPKYQWAAVTDATGVATFPRVPNDLGTEGLQIHAVATYAGLVFDSPAEAPSPGRVLQLSVFERGAAAESAIRLNKIRITVEPWEGYLVFRQTYFIENTSDKALDTRMLVGEKFEKGLPIDLPLKAKGIKAFGNGESLVVNSTIYWNGVLLPKRPIQLQANFSMSVDDSGFVYEQPVNYPTTDVEVIVPLQTQFKKLPRLGNLEMRPLGFKETERGPGIFGLRQDVDFVGARGLKLKAGDSFKFQLRGLPYRTKKTPWVVLGLALLSGILIFTFAMRGKNRADIPKEEIRKTLNEEQDALLAELLALEDERDDGMINEAEYIAESLAIRERLALILKKLSELES